MCEPAWSLICSCNGHVWRRYFTRFGDHGRSLTSCCFFHVEMVRLRSPRKSPVRNGRGNYMITRRNVKWKRFVPGLQSVRSEHTDRRTLEIVSAGLQLSFRMSKQITPWKTRTFQKNKTVKIRTIRGVASFTQIRTYVLEKLEGFFQGFLRTPLSIPFWVHGLISAAKVKERTTPRLSFSCKLPVGVAAYMKLYRWVK